MYWLVLYMISGYGVATTVVPEKYSTLEACHAAAKADKWSHSCLPAGDAGTCQQVVSGTNLVVNVPCSSIAGKP